MSAEEPFENLKDRLETAISIPVPSVFHRDVANVLESLSSARRRSNKDEIYLTLHRLPFTHWLSDADKIYLSLNDLTGPRNWRVRLTAGHDCLGGVGVFWRAIVEIRFFKRAEFRKSDEAVQREIRNRQHWRT